MRNFKGAVKAKIEKKEQRIKEISEYILNAGERGVTCKEITVEFHVCTETARQALLGLVDQGLVKNSRKEGCATIFTWNDLPEKAEQPKEEVMPVNHSSKEFKPGTFIPCSNVCKAGDVVWISSRSGEGAFFRYLIITPWEHKAMCLGIFEEGHPKLNLNDPYYVCIGTDPEKGVKLYADIRNNCQRGYQQFGERVMHVDAESFDVVKYRLARSMGICANSKPEVDNHTVNLQVKVSKLEATLKEKTDKILELMEDNDDLRAERDTALKQVDDAHVGWDQANRLATQFSNDVNDLSTENATLRDKLTKAEAENNELKKQKTVDGSTQRSIGQIVVANKVNEALRERYEDEIKTLRQVIFSMIKGEEVK